MGGSISLRCIYPAMTFWFAIPLRREAIINSIIMQIFLFLSLKPNSIIMQIFLFLSLRP